MPVQYLTPSACRQAMDTLLTTVPGIGLVHQRRRVIRSEQDLHTYLFDPKLNRVCGWFISPSATNAVVTDRKGGHIGHGVKGGGNIITTFQFQLEGMFGVDDANASESVFGDLVWAVCDEFNSYGTIALNPEHAPIPGIAHQLPCDVQQFGYIMFAGSILCHYARLEIGFQGRTRG